MNKINQKPLNADLLKKMDAYWRAANYLSVGQIYLYDNPLLKRTIKREHIKPRLLGHWGTTPGLNFIYVHLNRLIKEQDLNVIYITGPGHGGPGLIANTYLEGTYSEIYPNISQDEEGMKKLFKQFSFPGGIPSHVAPETPGSIHEGGELGYALAHAYGAVFDNPDLIAVCVVGDGEAVGLKVPDPVLAAAAAGVAVHIDGDGLGGLDGAGEGEGEQDEAAHGDLRLGQACRIVLPFRQPKPAGMSAVANE